MKFGAQLKSKSVPEWKAYNLEYNDIKFKIRIATENNNDEKLVQDLYNTLISQIDTVNMFLNSKVGEIKRRIVHAENNLESFNDDSDPHASYDVESQLSTLSSDLQKLSRFLVIQKTALRKLLKKYTKYSNDNGSLNIKINKYMIQNPDSFIHLDLTGLFLELALIYDLIREKKSINNPSASQNNSANSTPMKRRVSLANSFDELNINESFDFESVKSGNISEDYLVHYDNLAELKLFLLSNFYFIDESVTSQRQRLQLTKKTSTMSLHEIINKQNTNSDECSSSKANSEGSDEEIEDKSSIPKDIYRSNSIYINDTDKMTDNAQTTRLILEDPKSFISLKTNADPGVLITNLKDEHRSMLISAIGGLRKCSNVLLKNDEFVNDLLESCSTGEVYDDFYKRHSEIINSFDSLENISIEWLYSKHIKPYLKILLSESRFTNMRKTTRFENNSKYWISLTSNISISSEDLNNSKWNDLNESAKENFPYAHLRIRYMTNQTPPPESIKKLRSSHLIYRVDDSFSILTYHLFKSDKLSFTPSWANLFGESDSVDIRKLPPKIRRVKSQASKAHLSTIAELQAESETTGKGSVSGESSQFRYWNEFDNGSEGEQDNQFLIDVDSQEDQMIFSNNTIDKVYKISANVSGFLHHHFPIIFDSLDNEPLLKNNDHVSSYGGTTASDNSDVESLFDHEESKFAHDKFLVFLSLSSSILSLFLTAVSLGITSSLYRYDDVYIGPLVVAILLVAMLISLFFSVLALCLLMMSESENRSIWQTTFVWGVFLVVTILIIGGIVGVFGI